MAFQLHPHCYQRDLRIHHWSRICFHEGAQEYAFPRHVHFLVHVGTVLCHRRGLRLCVLVTPPIEHIAKNAFPCSAFC